MPIRILSEQVANQIAAGEVIERPASVVKELIENAIDAAATAIHIEIRGGGRRLVRVADDGSGIPADEVELAFARHATSKLQTIDDLTRLTTLGFRGEALASIAAVAHVTVQTRAEGEEVGTRLRLEAGRVARHEPLGHPRGTTISVENLFFNVPARQKFLRSEATERKHIGDLVTRYAMAYPQLRLALESDGRLSFRSSGNGSLYDVLIEIYGLETAQAMLAVGEETEKAFPTSRGYPTTAKAVTTNGHGSETGSAQGDGTAKVAPASQGYPETAKAVTTNGHGSETVSVWGYVSRPDTHRANREHITLFVNGRWIQDRGLTFAVEQAYHTLLPADRHPLAVLCVALPSEQVDVNVHPTKSEVKFQHRDQVFRAVQRTVRQALVAQAPIPEVRRAAGSWAEQGWSDRHGALVGAGAAQAALDLVRPAGEGAIGRWQPQAPADRQERLPVLRVLGQLAQTYIIAEGPEGMYLIDQHAAHERVIYERLLARQAGAALAVQDLLEPLPVELTPAQADELGTWLEPLREMGFQVEAFGGHTVLVRSVPAVLARVDVRQALTSILDELAQGEDALPPTGRLLDPDARLAAAACKRGATKAGQTLAVDEMQALIAQLEQTTAPRTCPHGRPTMILLSQAWMQREFGR